MSVRPAKIVAAVTAIALSMSSPAIAASSNRSAPAPINPWVALASFDSAAASAVATSVAPPEDRGAHGGLPPGLVIAGMLGAVLVAFAIVLSKGGGKGPPFLRPESP